MKLRPRCLQVNVIFTPNMKKILINAAHSEDIRVALMENNQLIEFDAQIGSNRSTHSNIYKGKISRVEPSLETVFVDYGEERHGFLPWKDIHRNYLGNADDASSNTPVAEQLAVGQELLVQVARTERDNKGAGLTTAISLAGRFLVMLCGGSDRPGISRRIAREHRRSALELVKQLTCPEGFGLILRTEGLDRSVDELNWDMLHLQKVWQRINEVASSNKAPCLILSEADIVVRTVRDYLTTDVDSIVIDNESIHQRFVELLEKYDPAQVPHTQLHTSDIPIFSFHNVEEQIASAFRSKVNLPSGGSMVIDQTEALAAIDINSARATKAGNVEDTAFATNMEAAREVARQLRIRDLGGLIVIDFIDMSRSQHQRAVRKQLWDSLQSDRARVQVGDISRFGLLEMSRQRLGQSLAESSSAVCSRCRGTGKVRSSEFMAITIMRLIHNLSIRDKTMQVNALLPVPVAAFLLNEKREDILNLEKQYDISILVMPSPNMHTPFFEVTCTNIDGSSYSIKDEEGIASSDKARKGGNKGARKNNEALIKEVLPDKPVPKAKSGFFAALVKFFSGGSSEASTKSSRKTRKVQPARDKNKAQGDSANKHQDGAGEGRNQRQRNQRGNRYPATTRSRNPANSPASNNRNRANSANDERSAENPANNRSPAPRPNNRRQGPRADHRNSSRAQEPTHAANAARDNNDSAASQLEFHQSQARPSRPPRPAEPSGADFAHEPRSPQPAPTAPVPPAAPVMPVAPAEPAPKPKSKFTQRVPNDPRELNVHPTNKPSSNTDE